MKKDSLVRRFVIPKIRYSDGSLVRRNPMAALSLDCDPFHFLIKATSEITNPFPFSLFWVVLAQPGFFNRGAKARERSDRTEGGDVGRFFFEISCMKMAFVHIKYHYQGVDYVKWHIPIPYFPFLIPLFCFTPISGGGAWTLVLLSYDSASGAARGHFIKHFVSDFH